MCDILCVVVFIGYQQHAVFAEQSQPPPPQPSHPAVTVPVSSAQPPSNSPQILPPPPTGPAFAPNYPSPPPAAFIPHAQPPPQPPRMFPPAPQPAPPFLTPTGSMINYVPTPPAQFTATYPPFQSFPPVVSLHFLFSYCTLAPYCLLFCVDQSCV